MAGKKAKKVKLDDLSLRRGELLGVGLMRVVGERIDSAMKELRSAAGKSPEKLDDCVHEARKRLKEARGIMHLSAKKHRKLAKVADRDMRDAGRLLAGQRDAAALVEACDKLRTWLEEKDDTHTEGEIEALKTVRAELDKARQSGKPVDPEPLVESLAESRARIAQWFPGEPYLTFKDARPGIATMYEVARSMHQVISEEARMPESGADAELNEDGITIFQGTLHKWRKVVKQHMYQLRVFAPVWPESMKVAVDSLKQLADLLGDHHDLDILEKAGRELSQRKRKHVSEERSPKKHKAAKHAGAEVASEAAAEPAAAAAAADGASGDHAAEAAHKGGAEAADGKHEADDEQEPAFNARSAQLLKNALRRKRRTLLRDALPLGARLFAEEPHAFVERLSVYWSVWRREEQASM